MKQFVLKGLKVLLGLLVSLGVALYVVVNYSRIDTEMTCDGLWLRGTERKPEVAHVILTEYRPWVHLWTESDGALSVQTEILAMSTYLPLVEKIGNGSLALYSLKEDKLGRMVGGYRAANGEITIKFLDDLTFVGVCRRRNNAAL